MAGSSVKKTEDMEVDISNQENVSQRPGASKRSSKLQTRHRASVACASCRDRRIRCVVPKGESECTQCKRSGTECVIKNDDERRRPISKAYMSSLSARINMLEDMLLEKGVVPPPPSHPPKTRQEEQPSSVREESQAPTLLGQHHMSKSPEGANSPTRDVPSPPDSYDDFPLSGSPMEDVMNSTLMSASLDTLHREPSPFRKLDAKQEDAIYRLFATKGSLSFDQISGRLRFFGPTANSHVYADSSDKSDTREPPEQIRRAERIIRSLTPETHDYLIQCFFEYYNNVLQVIDRKAFEADRDSQNPKLYSSFLHITILAAGWRFGDKERDDVARLNLGNRESTLHREAKYMLDIELERPGGVPSVQALLILGDLECGVGRDNTGWMYSGMANRLAFDVGLHLDCTINGLPDPEVRIRQMVMRACVLYDKYWALFLGRPTSIKSQDIGMDLLTKRFSSTLGQLGQDTAAVKPFTSQAAEEEIHEQLVELMDLAGRIVEVRENNARSGPGPDHANLFAINENEDNAYMQVIALDRQLQNWYRRLPEHLTWKPENMKTSVFSYFLLHQQYHVTMILLHRQWARYGSSNDGSSPASHPSPEGATRNGAESLNQHHSPTSGLMLGLGDPSSLVEDSRTSLSRSICTQQAIRIARVFWQAKQRFDLRKIACTGMQHAGTASIALIAAIAYHKSEADRRNYLGYLEVLADAIQDMSVTYQPAARMGELIHAVLAQLRSDAAQGQHSRAGSFTNRARDTSMIGGIFGMGDTNPYPVIPARRENADHARQSSCSNKRPRATPSRRASEFARPPPPFYMSAAQPTPPGSAGFGNGNAHYQHHHQASGSASELFSIFSEPPAAPFDLDTLRGSSAIDVDGSVDGSTSAAAGGNGYKAGERSDNYLLVAPSANGWSLHSVHADPHAPQHGIQQQAPPVRSEFDFQMSDWIGSSPADADAGGLPLDAAAQVRGGKDGTNSLDWMTANGTAAGLSPVSLGDMATVHSPEKPAAVAVASEGGDTGPPRGHELDFFSF